MPHPRVVSPAPIEGLPELPVRVNRRSGAEIISRLFFPVKARTLEVWPVPSRIINGKALYETSDLIAYAKTIVDAGRPTRTGQKAPL